MFYDKDSMLEMFEISSSKTNWRHLLITSELVDLDYDVITSNEVVDYHRTWKDAVKSSLDAKDAAYLINQGNIFCLIHEAHADEFETSIKRIIYNLPSHQGEIHSTIERLSVKETEFLLKLS